MKIFVCLVAVVALFSLACSEEMDDKALVQDIVAAAPDNAKVLLDNDSVSVVLFTVPPQGHLPMHRGLDRVVYSLSDHRIQYLTPAKLQFTVGEESTETANAAGEANWHDGGEHAVANLSDEPARYLVIELI